MNKPFIFGVAASGDNFTDREVETKRLLTNFTHGVNTILISPRRWGKTSLVKKACSLARSESLKVVYLDIFSCRNEDEFYHEFATSVLKQTSSKMEEWMEYAKAFLARISPRFTMGTDPMTDFSISLDYDPKTESANDILQLPEKIAQKKGVRIVICIDEFQQISEFANSKVFQKRLRGVWQLQEQVSYCLFGSKKHLMNELFERSSLPFYKFGDTIYLPKISTMDWVSYIVSRFESTGKRISQDWAECVCEAVNNHSSYVQQLAWILWIHTEKDVSKELFDTAVNDLLDQNTPLFQKEIEGLSAYQMNFLRAVASGVHSEFSSLEILRKYNLGSSANTVTIKKALQNKELIDVEGKEVHISDPVFCLWFRKRVME